ncbi:hypothetical protein BDV96DRAFT_569962 [Lophiotrema nucula]|uniref:Uncharacterized protein n=1 Tax=Lophiotrema nucula TaxID=690887 RepID=A0A6A5ZG75_9PLEO|nr:hypothetical protein BDV96DRAFT_569962 [Lophiotrema nucula]
MYQRHFCPSMGAVWRPLSKEIPTLINGYSRPFHRSARLEADSNDAGNSDPRKDPTSQPPRETRRSRAAAAGQRVINLSNRPSGPGGLARGVFPSGQGVSIPVGQTLPEALGAEGSTDPSSPAPTAGRTRPLIRREIIDPSSTGGSRPPPGTLVRAPTNLRISRAAAPGTTRVRGPDLRGRDRSAPQNSGERAPKRRERKSGTASSGAGGGRRRNQDVKVEDTLSDAMVQHLLRLQRKEWDRVPYEPKYVQGRNGKLSPAALELQEAGKKLFEGEPPKTPSEPGRLERRLQIAGLHGV